jgi:hypothetical protein
MRNRPWICLGALLIFVLSAGACNRSAPDTATLPAAPAEEVELAKVLSVGSQVVGWTQDGETEIYDEDTLFDLVNGQADAFYAYNFRQVAVQRYRSDTDDVLRVELWELATPHDAYGLFTRNASGTSPAAGVGNDTDEDPGRRLAFWQDRYFVQIRSHQPLPEESIAGVAREIAGALPQGGERPHLIAALPAEGRTHDRAVFFRLEISIQDEIWLGGENILNLGPESMGVLAHYEIAGRQVTLLLTQYPDAAEATAALERLREYGPADLAAAEIQGAVLTALFGALDPDPAQAWLQALSITAP